MTLTDRCLAFYVSENFSPFGGALGSGAAPGADIADARTVVMDACLNPFRCRGQGWSENGLREGTVADALYPTPIRNGPAIQTKK